MPNFLDGLGTMFNTVVEFTDKHPIATYLLSTAVASAMTPDAPDEIDILREKDRLERERQDEDRQRVEKNLDVSDVDLKVKPSGAKGFMDSNGTSTNPMDIINTTRRGYLNRKLAGQQ